MNNWIKLTVNVSRETEEIVTAILTEKGAGGVEIEDSRDYLSLEDNSGELWSAIEQFETIRISAYYPEDQISPEFLSDLRIQLSSQIGKFELETDKLAEEDWADGWKKYFTVSRISRDLTIVPSWTEYEAESSSEKLIRLDPGMAFGTGTHPTTKLSLFALEQVLRGGEKLLDVGTGSGVLSIAAALLGASEIYAYDLDEVAVRVANENIALNSEIAEKIQVKAADLLTEVTQEADVIVANILADILLLMIDDAYRLIKMGGHLILSGIITEKSELVLAKAFEAGFKLETRMQQGNWHCFVLVKKEEELFFG